MAASLHGMKIPEHMKNYINGQLEPILEDLVTECLTTLPDDPTSFLLDFLSSAEQVGAKPLNDEQLTSENEKMKREIQALKNFANEVSSQVAAKQAEEAAAEEEEEEDSDVDDEPPPGFDDGPKRGMRQSVSAEAYGEWNKEKEFVAPVIQKTEEQKASIRPILKGSFLFQALDDKNVEIVVNAMKERTLQPGDFAIKQGDDGDYLFIIAKGAFECWIKKADGEEKMVGARGPGDVFGELALMYNCPRAASVKATELSVCWQLDRETFNAIVKKAATEKREMSMGVLKKVDLLSSMDSYELGQLADALVSQSFESGAEIIKEGDKGDKFYILAEGTASATKDGVGEVMKYEGGQFFGELALINDKPRAATVTATSKSACLVLDGKAFKRLLGGAQSLLMNKKY